MKIFVGADHRGLEIKKDILEYLQNKNIETEDMGPYEYDAEDDYPDFAQKVSRAVLENPEENLGIVICGSGIGVTMAANRFKGIRCALAFREDQVKHGRENDHINVLALPADYITMEETQKFIDAFISTPILPKEKYIRRANKLDNI